MIGEVVTWLILVAMTVGLFLFFYYWMFPFLEEKYPENKYRVVGISTLFWTGTFIILVWGFRPLF